MATEKVKVYEEQPGKKGMPIWAWLLPLLLLLALAAWWFSRSHNTDTAAAPTSTSADTSTAAPAAVGDTTKPDATQGTQVLTAAAIGDTIRKDGRLSLDDTQVHFATNSAALAGDSQAVLDQVAQALKTNSDWKMRVVGYTDATGKTAANDALAQQRAQSVMAYLGSHGVAANRLRVEAEGPSNPVASNASDRGRAMNRRVELIKD